MTINLIKAVHIDLKQVLQDHGYFIVFGLFNFQFLLERIEEGSNLAKKKIKLEFCNWVLFGGENY